MITQLSRRKSVAAAGVGTLASPALLSMAQNQTPSSPSRNITQKTLNPVVVAAANGNRSRDAEGLFDPVHFYGTINRDGINAEGGLCGVTTTSGLAWKIPGRVGDSPILGAGLFVDGDIGAAGSTERGEANLFSLCSFMIVEAMRNGASPKDAGMSALKRIAGNAVEIRLRNSRGRPNFNVNFYVLNARGEYAGVAFDPSRYAVCSEDGPRTLPCETMFSDGAEN